MSKKQRFKLFDALELQERVQKLEMRLSAVHDGVLVDHQERIEALEETHSYATVVGLHEVRIGSLEAQLVQALEFIEEAQQRQFQLLGDMAKLAKAVTDFARGEQPDAA